MHRLVRVTAIDVVRQPHNHRLCHGVIVTQALHPKPWPEAETCRSVATATTISVVPTTAETGSRRGIMGHDH